jgi:transposase InsO family protein
MVALARAHPRYGYRRITARLRLEGWRVNRKRVQRLWRREGLKVPQKQRKKRRLGCSANGAARRRADHRNQVWSYDFIEDQTADGRKLKILPIVDEFTRECLTIEVERHLTAQEVVETLAFLFELRGAPRYLRSDNGPEFIAKAVRNWLIRSGVNTLYIEPGSPWENPYSESFNSRFRDELLNRELFDTLHEAKVLIEDFRLEYNHRRPHSALGYRTPAAYAALCAAEGGAPRETRGSVTDAPGRSLITPGPKNGGRSCSCSVRRLHRDAPFIPEYIVPQLILQWVATPRPQDGNRPDGIVYFSVNADPVPNSDSALLNYVFPVQTSQKEGHCPVLKAKFELSQPVSWQLIESSGLAKGKIRHPTISVPIGDTLATYHATSFGIVESRLAELPRRPLP